MKNETLDIKPVIVVGCPRSGTSLVAGILSKCNMFTGDTGEPTVNNRKGFFENLEIRNTVIKPMLLELGADPKCQNPLPDPKKVKAYSMDYEFVENKCRKPIMDILDKQGWDPKASLWLLKEPKITSLWEIFNTAFPKARWIVVRRMEEDTAASCARTSFMNAYHSEEDWLDWVKLHSERLDDLVFKPFEVPKEQIMEVYPQKIINQMKQIQTGERFLKSLPITDPTHQFHLPEAVFDLLRWLADSNRIDGKPNFPNAPKNFENNVEAIREFISPELWPPSKVFCKSEVANA